MTTPATFRNRPTEIEAVQWTGTNADALSAFCSPFDFQTLDREDRIEDPDETAAVRESEHGTWRGLKPGDWVVKRSGDLFECSAADFAKLYEPGAAAAEQHAAVLREAAAIITARQDRLDAEERAEHGSLDHETVLQGQATRAMAELLRHLAGEASPSPYYEHPECGFHWHGRDGMDIPMRNGQPVCPRCELRRLAGEAAGRVADDTQPETQDTFPAWLYQRFMQGGAGWDNLDDDQRAYWEHQARAVRRAVERGGFKPAGVGAQQPQEDEDRVVAYRGPGSDTLHCIGCAPTPAGDIWTSVTAEELEHGGGCTVCGVDLLIPQETNRG